MSEFEEGGLYFVRSRHPDDDDYELAQYRAGEFIYFGTDETSYPEDVLVLCRVTAVKAAL